MKQRLPSALRALMLFVSTEAGVCSICYNAARTLTPRQRSSRCRKVSIYLPKEQGLLDWRMTRGVS